jgi:hypothetical protein
MADFTKKSVADMAAAHPDVNAGTTGNTQLIDWDTEDVFWRSEYARRPYARADRDYEHFRPAYRYGAESAARHAAREWPDVEPELERGWPEFCGATTTAWVDVKAAVRDAWDRVRGKRSRVEG